MIDNHLLIIHVAPVQSGRANTFCPIGDVGQKAVLNGNIHISDRSRIASAKDANYVTNATRWLMTRTLQDIAFIHLHGLNQLSDRGTISRVQLILLL